jgi:hypothetical protein
MKVRADIAELLHAGWSDKRVASQLHVHRRQVREARRVLRLPAHKPGPPATPIEDLFWRRAQRTEDGHLLWTGATTVLRAGNQGPRTTAGRVAFRIKHDRDPVGKVLPGCDRPGCIHPDHVEDQPMRDQYRAIFGAAA